MARKSRAVSPDSQQPRALTSESLAIQPYFRGSMYMELQKFQNRDKDRQLLLGETDFQEAEIEASGLDLTVSEDRALHALQVLLNKTDYCGNIPGEIVSSTGYKFQGLIPRLSITYSDYFEAYGLEQRGDQYYQGRQSQEAIQALRSLAETRRICYSRRRYSGKRPVYDVIRVTRPLISFIEGFQGLEEEEAGQILAGQELPEKRQTRLVIEVSPLFMDQIDSFFLLKPTALHSEIKQLLGSKRISRAVSLFLEWLLTKNTKTVKISKVELAERLRQDYLIEQRHWKKLDTRLQEAFQTAKKLEYLLDYRKEPSGLLIFTLNPERCRRIRQAEPGEEEEEG